MLVGFLFLPLVLWLIVIWLDMDDTVSFADIYSWLEHVKNKSFKKDKGVDGVISFLGALKKKLIDPSLAKAQEKREGRDDSFTTSTTSSSDSRISVDIGAQVGPFDEARSGIEVEFQQDATLCRFPFAQLHIEELIHNCY